MSRSDFTVWERRILKRWGKGESARSIALDLGLAPRTVQRWVSQTETLAKPAPLTAPLESWVTGGGGAGSGAKKAGNKTQPGVYILTSWEIRVGVSEPFLDCLLQMAKYYNAELRLSSVWPEDHRWMPEALRKNFTMNHEEWELNSNLRFKYVPTHALAHSPLSGWRGAVPGQSVIIPGLVRELVTETSRKTGKQMMTTGSIGSLDANLTNYEFLSSEEDRRDFARRWMKVQDRRGGHVTALATNYIVPSALIVEVLDDGRFLTRYVTMTDGESVYDLGLKFTAGSRKPKASRPSALVVGDTHAWTVDVVNWRATLDMVNVLHPDQVILNDFFDGAAINHHEIGSAYQRSKLPFLESEADETKQMLREIADKSEQVIYLQSNHDNFLEKWLDMGQSYWTENYELALSLELGRIRTGLHPIEILLQLDEIDNVTFHPDTRPYFVGDVSVIHGHTGVGGRPATFKTLAQTYNRLVSGHTHSPAVFRNAVNVGHTCLRDQAYAKGANGWYPANAIIQPDSNTQLLPVVGGEWIGR